MAPQAVKPPAPITLSVDASALRPLSTAGGPTGVGRWTLGVLRGLSERRPDWCLRLLVVGRDTFAVDPEQIGPNVEVKRIAVPVRWQRRMLYVDAWPSLERVSGASDALLGPAFVTWRTAHTPTLPVLHDLTYVKYAEYVSPRHLLYLKRVVPRAVRRAALVVTVSETMRAEVSEHFDVPPERVAVVPNACDERFAISERPLRLKLPSRYFLSLGTLEPRKNAVAVLRAHRRLRETDAQTPSLVVVGGRGWKEKAMGNDFERLLKGEGVTYLDYIDDAELPALYAGAEALVFPSFYEGFGLPVLEAMTAGCPVITSDRGALREVGGEAALYVDPEDDRDIAGGMAALSNDIQQRRSMTQRGREQAARYSWSRSGEALAQAIEQVVQGAAEVR